MNSSTSDQTGGFLGSKEIGGFGYGIGVSVGILLLITSITLASYFCTRSPPPHPSPSRRRRSHLDSHEEESPDVAVDVGLDEETIRSYPKVKFREAEALKKSSTKATAATTTTLSCCSICLADYKAADTLRQLPDCGHLFHVKCVDPWLRLHPTCPVCRTSPAPTPLATPLAEVVPLATRRD